MLLDNEDENKNLKVHEWIEKYTQSGKLSIVTGYFTIGALAWLAEVTNKKISEYKFILGDIVNFDADKDRALDLLNENISIEASLKLSKLAKEAVEFLSLKAVAAKTLEPNFCHAKAYLYKHAEQDVQKNFYIVGSSNLTEAGLGSKKTSNVELNIANFGADPQYNELLQWFDGLWERKEAHDYKTVIDKKGGKKEVPFKQYLIDEIQKIFIPYTPKQLYYKVLFELFGSELLLETENPEFNRQIERLENTAVYNALYEFQQKGVLSLIKMLQKHKGAILADAVGLGKTWTALAVMKFYQLQGHEVILICPKKLQYNWRTYQRNQNSKFEQDQLEYFMRFHTDFTEGLMENYVDRADKLFVNDKPKLFVIDESHNLRNDKSKRYQFLVAEILAKNENAKVLMLSATPINNSLLDIRNQFKLMVGGKAEGFEASLDIKNIEYTFRTAQTAFNEWAGVQKPKKVEEVVADAAQVAKKLKISELIRLLPPNFFKLTDALIVARTRKMIEGQQDGLTFPKKNKPKNFDVTPKQIGNVDSFEELFELFPPMLSGYQPSFYIKKEEKVNVLHDEKQRERFLVKMMYILLAKRLESSWCSFQATVAKILAHHQNALDRVREYQRSKTEINFEDAQMQVFEDDDSFAEAEDFVLGKKRKIHIADIDRSGNIENFIKDLKVDIQALRLLEINLKDFAGNVANELKTPKNHKSKDEKLEKLIEEIKKKRAAGANSGNPKVLIFTVYKDTALYLFEQLKARGFDKLAAVTGDISLVSDGETETKQYEPILERFAPFTKLFREKEWAFQPLSNGTTIESQFEAWKNWIVKNDSRTANKLQNPIDILIATDVLSEGQNLQDCDMVINYDIHWNPVRVIQRMGRIDRLGSPNSEIFGINFWPTPNINKYLKLQTRIEQRMATMKLAGAEVDLEFTEDFKKIAEDEQLERKQNNKMLEQMESSWEEIDGEKSLGFDDLSLEIFRQELLAELKTKEDFYKNMPKGIYTGFKIAGELCPKTGMIALLGYPSRGKKAGNIAYKGHELIYIDEAGKAVVCNQKDVLDALAQHKNELRFVPTAIEQGEATAIEPLSAALLAWLKAQAVTEERQEDGSTKITMGQAPLDMLNKIKAGGKTPIQQLKEEGAISEKFSKENFDLITWFIVSGK